MAVAGYDGMHLIAEALKKTGAAPTATSSSKRPGA